MLCFQKKSLEQIFFYLLQWSFNLWLGDIPTGLIKSSMCKLANQRTAHSVLLQGVTQLCPHWVFCCYLAKKSELRSKPHYLAVDTEVYLDLMLWCMGCGKIKSHGRNQKNCICIVKQFSHKRNIVSSICTLVMFRNLHRVSRAYLWGIGYTERRRPWFSLWWKYLL